MAFVMANFSPAGAQSKRGKAPQKFTYKTDDTHATVDSAGYFNGGVAYGGVYNLLEKCDIIEVVVVTNLGASNEAIATWGPHLVKDKASGTVDVVDVGVVLAVTDTD